MKSKRKTFLFFSTGALAVAALLAGSEALARYEEPNYTILKKWRNVELRQYPSVIAAEVVLDGTWETTADQSFKILAGYIFGKNIRREKVEMTVPVTQVSEKVAMTVPVTAQTSNGKMLMRFYMPSKYDLQSLPEPIDKRIKFLKMEPSSYLVIRFSGTSSDENMIKHEVLLKNCLESKKLISIGPAVRAFYNPPWTLPFMRRNEVWIPVAPSQDVLDASRVLEM